MSANDWMGSRTESNVQTAIDSQTIQTTLEQNTSSLSPTAFNSFLQNAPIPRFSYTTIGSTHNAATNLAATWTSAGAFDPYAMMTPATGVVTIPIDGFYQFNFGLDVTGGAGGEVIVSYVNTAAANLARDSINFVPTATTIYLGSVPMTIPLRQGDTVRAFLGNNTVGNLSALTCSFVGVWLAPYNTYQTGAGGN